MAHREEAISRRIREIITDLSGLPAEELGARSTFLELGFDSLFLTQLSTALQNEFEVSITFRQLFSELPSVSAVTKHLDEVLPEDAIQTLETPFQESRAENQAQDDRATQDQGPEPSSIEASEEGGPVPLPDLEPASSSAPSAGAPAEAGDLQRMIERQLQLMSEQLAVLRGSRTRPEEHAGESRAPSHEVTAADETTVPAEAPSGEVSTTLPEGFVLDSRRGDRGSLTEAQRQHLNAFIQRYTERTATSKRMTQQYRQWHADPRTAAGFNPLWKEMVYPLVVKRSSGARLWDVDDNEYIDVLNGFGPNFLGHSPPFITEALKDQLERGVEVGPQTLLAGETAQLFCELTGNERVTFVNTGSEAVQAAIRLSRTVTGRDRIVVFRKDYHGNFDEVLVRGLNAGEEPRTMPLAPGIPRRAVEDVVVLEYGSDQALEWIRDHASSLAAVLVEPVQSRQPELQPREFLHELRSITAGSGTVLIFDEVITGLRMGPGGAQELFGVEADVATYGKVLGGGMPIGAVAGKARFMDTFDGGMWQYGDDSFPEAGVTFFAGTFVRHPMAIAGANATLKYLKAAGPGLQEGVSRKAARLVDGIEGFAEAQGLALEMPRCASLMYLRLHEKSELAPLLFYHLRDRGIYVQEGFPCYMTVSHTDEDVDAIIQAFTSSVEELQEAEVLPLPREDAAGTVSSSDPEGEPAGTEMGRAGHWPMTEAQQEVWATSRLEPLASLAFNEANTIRLQGEVELEALRWAFRTVVERHEALRTRFDPTGETQEILPCVIPEFRVEDLRNLVGPDRARRLAELVDQEMQEPFDLEAGPLIRSLLVQLSPTESRFVVTGHHLVMDGWSANVVLGDLARLYEARVEGANRDPLEPPFQMSRYVEWLQEDERAKAYEGAERYWLRKLDPPVPPLKLPLDHPRRDGFGFESRTERSLMNGQLRDLLKQVGARTGNSLFGVFLAAYGAFLHRLTGQRDLLVGVAAAGQNLVGRSDLVGHCVHMLPVRIGWEGDPSFADFARTVGSSLLDGSEHQLCTYGSIARKLPRQSGGMNTIRAQLNFERADHPGVGDSRLSFGGLEVEVDEVPKRFVISDVFLNVKETPDGAILDWRYNSELLDSETVGSWARAFGALLEGIAEDFSEPLDALPLVTEQAKEQLLVDFNRSRIQVEPNHETVLSLVRRQVKETPDRVAVRYRGASLTYRQLWARAGEIGARLRGMGIDAEDVVGVLLERSEELPVALLGVLRSGAAYLALDPEYPDDRLRTLLEDAEGRALLTHGALVRGRELGATRQVLVDDRGQEPDEKDFHAGEPAEEEVRASDLMYVLYTSGSTGRPKGVEVEHGSVANFLQSVAQEPGIEPGEVLVALASASFDMAVPELFLPLVVGATCEVAPDLCQWDAEVLAELLDATDADVLQATPSTLQMLLDAGWSGGGELRVWSGGEALSESLVHAFLPKVAELWNLYGPTETTCAATVQRVLGPSSPVPIGRPIANVRAYVLDRHSQLVPPGVPGELYLAGAGVARGYHGLLTETAERFLSDPYSGDASRMYRTGDRVRWRPDGTLLFEGRMDDQIQLRGYRIEPGEVEAALEALPEVRQARIAVQGEGHDRRLVAYVVFSGGAELMAGELRRALGRTLPGHMVPGLFVPLDQIPVNARGKVDYEQLPEPLAAASAPSREAEPPDGPLEEAIARVWSDLLEVERVSRHDNFFELGGHSLLAFQAALRMEEETGHRIEPRTLFFRSLAQLAEEVSRRDGESPGDSSREWSLAPGSQSSMV